MYIAITAKQLVLSDLYLLIQQNSFLTTHHNENIKTNSFAAMRTLFSFFTFR